MKKFFIALIGGTVLLIGAAMLVLPGPGLLVIAGGLAILAMEFFWARAALALLRAGRRDGQIPWTNSITSRSASAWC